MRCHGLRTERWETLAKFHRHTRSNPPGEWVSLFRCSQDCPFRTQHPCIAATRLLFHVRHLRVQRAQQPTEIRPRLRLPLRCSPLLLRRDSPRRSRRRRRRPVTRLLHLLHRLEKRALPEPRVRVAAGVAAVLDRDTRRLAAGPGSERGPAALAVDGEDGEGLARRGLEGFRGGGAGEGVVAGGLVERVGGEVLVSEAVEGGS
mmetsp:Transcript_15079/g.38605  ORF Transcript_15079/g.38605 Transcript_15079/m.38605 type:complete len:203 (+) Transcript_15079:281-889(+)